MTCKMPDPAKAGSRSEKPHFLGHRERLRGKLRDNGSASLADYELLELILFRAVQRADTKPLAKNLIAKFGSFAEVLAAPPARLKEIEGVGEAVTTELKIVAAAAERMTQDIVREKKVLSSWKNVLDYCRVSMAFADKEHFRILFLDKNNALIVDELQQSGTVDHTPVYPREVIKRALELSASALILVHNHPSGDPTPSSADIAMTKKIIDIAAPLGVKVHDHIIVGTDGHASMRGLQLL